MGNPGDYAWGRENFDAIVTQLLNQIESTGPPPLAKEKISEIPVVYISQEQVGMLNLNYVNHIILVVNTYLRNSFMSILKQYFYLDICRYITTVFSLLGKFQIG